MAAQIAFVVVVVPTKGAPLGTYISRTIAEGPFETEAAASERARELTPRCAPGWAARVAELHASGRLSDRAALA